MYLSTTSTNRMLLSLLASVDTRPSWIVDWELSWRKCLISVAEEDLFTAQRMRLQPVLQHGDLGTIVHAYGCSRAYNCNPAIRAALPKDHQGQAKQEKLLLQKHSSMLVSRRGLQRPSRSPVWLEVHLWKQLAEVAFLYMVCKTSTTGWEWVFMRMF